jgi:hypothetical protein
LKVSTELSARRSVLREMLSYRIYSSAGSSRLAKKDLKELLQSLGVVFQETRVPLHKALTHCPFADEAPALDGTALNDFLREQSARSSKETPLKETGEESNEKYVDDDLGNANEKQEESHERADKRDNVEVDAHLERKPSLLSAVKLSSHSKLKLQYLLFILLFVSKRPITALF